MNVAPGAKSSATAAGTTVPPRRENVCAVVVTFHPDTGFGSRLESIAAQVAGVIVVDNTADGTAAATLRAFAARVGAQLVLNAENLGIATALNIGFRCAADHGYAWALTVDQDSVPSPGLVDGLSDAFRACGFGNTVGAIGANWINAATATVSLTPSRFRGRSWRESAVVINSGTLFSLTAHSWVGSFRDDFFIDSVDHEYCLRLRAKGYRVIGTRDALMRHPIGAFQQVRLLGMAIAHTEHPPLRKYFQTRNRLVLIREYASREPLWVLGQVGRMMQDLVLMLWVGRSRRRKIAAMALGVQHFLRGRMGPLSEAELRRLNA